MVAEINLFSKEKYKWNSNNNAVSIIIVYKEPTRCNFDSIVY
jgi:hypothetical protein